MDLEELVRTHSNCSLLAIKSTQLLKAYRSLAFESNAKVNFLIPTQIVMLAKFSKNHPTMIGKSFTRRSNKKVRDIHSNSIETRKCFYSRNAFQTRIVGVSSQRSLELIERQIQVATKFKEI